jgi:hypothetical protein
MLDEDAARAMLSFGFGRIQLALAGATPSFASET